MPIHDVGYRTWSGRLTSGWSRWWTITEVGVRSAFQSRWIRRALFASWIPLLYLGFVFFMFEKFMETSSYELVNQSPVLAVNRFKNDRIREIMIAADERFRNRDDREIQGADIQDDDIQGADIQGADIQGADIQDDDIQDDDIQVAQDIQNFLDRADNVTDLDLDELIRNVRERIDDSHEATFVGDELQKLAELSSDDIVNHVANQSRLYQLRGFFQMIPGSESLINAVDTNDPSMVRNRVWSWMLNAFLRYPQGIMTLMIVGLIVPPLIARDVRSRAFLLYYSRPISRLEYMLGKLAIPAVILSMITFVPAMGLFFFGIMLSPDLTIIFDTWDIPFRILAAALVCIIPTSMIALFFSSLTQESRFAGFAWFAIWGLGAVVWSVVSTTNLAMIAERNGMDMSDVHYDSNWSLISIYSTIGRVQSWVFGLETDMSRVLPSLIVLLVISAVAFVGLYRRVSAPVRV